MRHNIVEIKNLKQFKVLLDRLVEDDTIEFKTRDGKQLTFYGIVMPGIVVSETKREVIKQSIVFTEN
jgi:hypothetical protein